ncbi:MAG: hypothetical protein HRF46_12490 [Acidobacteriota bacterium]|jgi:hypothetical protein
MKAILVKPALVLLLGPALPAAAQAPAAQAPPVSSGILRWARAEVTRPLWVPASLAALPDGSPDVALLGETIRWTLMTEAERTKDLEARRTAAMARGERADPPARDLQYDWKPDVPADCISWFYHSYMNTGTRAPTSLDEVAQYAHGVYRGTIVAIEGGFLRFSPEASTMSLLHVEVTEVVRRSDAYGTPRVLYVAYPYARFSFAGRKLCRDDPSFRHAPAVGEEVLILATTSPRDAGRQLVIADVPEVLLHQTVDGALVIPPPPARRSARTLWDDLAGARTLDDVVMRMRSRLEDAKANRAGNEPPDGNGRP